MNKQEKEVIQSQLDDEKQALKDLERQYQRALRDINERIRILQSEDTPSRAYQASYQKTLKAQVEAILEKLHADEYDTMSQYLSKSYTSGYVGTMYTMGKRSGVHVITPLDQKAAAKAIVTDSKLSTDLYAALGYDMDILKKRVREEITRGIATSLPYEQIARNISNYTTLPLSNANRIVRTEGHRIQQASADDARNAAKAKGADVVKQWDASLDGATRPLHRQLDGQIRETDEPFEAGGKKVMYPGKFGKPEQDCNCRCVALTRARWALDEKELETLKERAKFFDLDKTESFREYEEKYLKASKEMPESKGFIPAKTIEQAVGLAKESGIKYVYYDDMPLETANLMNQAVLTLPEDIRPEFIGMSKDVERISRVKFSRSSKQYYGVSLEVMDMYFGDGKYDFDGGNMVGISSYYKTTAKITKAKKQAQEAYVKKYGHKWFFNEDGESTPFHEMGHVYANKKGLPKGFENDALKWAKESGCDMLKKPSEAWAEAWAAYHTQKEELPDYIKKYIQEAKSASKVSNIKKNGLYDYEEDGIIKKRIEEFSKDLKDGRINTKISQQKQARHMPGSKEYQRYTEQLSKRGDVPSYFKEGLTVDDLTKMVKGKLGTGIIEIKNDGSIQEFFDCDEIIGYWYDKSAKEYVSTRRVQVKYALGGGNIHIIPVEKKGETR